MAPEAERKRIKDYLDIEEDRLGFAGLLAISLGVLFHVLAKDALSTAEQVALASSAVSTPVLACMLLALTIRAQFPTRNKPKTLYVAAAIGIAGAVVGIASLLWARSHWVCIGFSASGIVAFTLVYLDKARLEELN